METKSTAYDWHQANLNAAYREIINRQMQGENMAGAVINKVTYAIEIV